MYDTTTVNRCIFVGSGQDIFSWFHRLKNAKVMLNKFLSYIEDKKLIIPGSVTLLSVSGGKDSMVLTDLMLKAGMPIMVGHINHHLRGAESEEDALFVKNYCLEHDLPYHQYDVDPYLLSTGNLQNKARLIRYNQLQKWATEYGCRQIATAHHLDDRIETFLMNIMRGTGMNGMTSILPRNENIIRPMLWATTDEIMRYVRDNSIFYREDSSNASDKYLRNQVRHHILPAMIQADNRSYAGLRQTIRNMESTVTVFDYLMENFRHTVVSDSAGKKVVDLSHLLHQPFASDVLYQIIRIYGFNILQCVDMIQSQQGRYYSNSHEAIVHQQKVLIRVIAAEHESVLHIMDAMPFELQSGDIHISMEVSQDVEQNFDNKNQFFLDADVISWPITIRSRKPGDVFEPYGMHGKKQKVKKYLTNRKLTPFDKENIRIVEDKKRILAVLPCTIANAVQVTSESENIAVIHFKIDNKNAI